ncbi:hypothetical protein CL622_05855 [archaeon]|nr:hypothetical protein [archaeon]|tara:strand:+ start:1189 stop:1440 length:252 start_codon:yes stop_codon:yes gene_type:complete
MVNPEFTPSHEASADRRGPLFKHLTEMPEEELNYFAEHESTPAASGESPTPKEHEPAEFKALTWAEKSALAKKELETRLLNED